MYNANLSVAIVSKFSIDYSCWRTDCCSRSLITM